MFQKSETLTSDDHLLIQKEFVYFYRPTDYEDNAVDAEERLFTIFLDVFGPSRLYGSTQTALFTKRTLIFKSNVRIKNAQC